MDNSISEEQLWKLKREMDSFLDRKENETGRDRQELLEELKAQIRHENAKMTEEQEDEALRNMKKWLDSLPTLEPDESEEEGCPEFIPLDHMDPPGEEDDEEAYGYDNGCDEDTDIDDDEDIDIDDIEGSENFKKILNIYQIDMKNLRQDQWVSEISGIMKEIIRGENISISVRRVEERPFFQRETITATVVEVTGDSLDITDTSRFYDAMSMTDNIKFEILDDYRIHIEMYVYDTKHITTMMFDGDGNYGVSPF